MMDIGSTELLMIVIVAIVVIGPKDLPRALYKVGQVIGKAKGMARHFRSGIDAMVREVELEEMEKKWKADNERIMREYAAANPAAAPVPTPAAEPAPAMEPLPEPPAALAAPAAPAAPVTEGER
jgi:sec-independent protein translocase protein TatB